MNKKRFQAWTIAAQIVLACLLGCVPSEPIAEVGSIPSILGSELQDFLTQSDLPVLVEFGVDYRCERCAQMKPSVVDLGQRFEGRVNVVRVDFNSNVKLVSELGGSICPTYVFFQDGEPVRTESFPVSTEILESHLQSMIGTPPAP